ncbi:hypothetical protein AMJ47_01040 [Parcubacteria bacterium DG_72]|nr:MAG: hypothetical protein AMJ47_01040 [Parcubacteria bacterium DG_72]
MKAFGIDISDHSIEVFQMASNRRVKAFARVLLEDKIIEDGIILNEEKLVQKIKEVVRKAKIKGKKVIFSLPESKAFIHFFRDKENILAQAEKIIPLDKNEIYFDVKKGLYVASSKKIVDSYIKVLTKAGLKPVAAETESISLGRSLNAKNCLVVDMGARTTNLSIFGSDNNLRLSVNIKKAGNHFTQAIAENLGLSLEKAQKLKKECGLDPKKGQGRIMLILQKEIEPVIKEIRKAIAFYGQNVEKVFLVGGSARMPKIADYLSSNIGINTLIGKSSIGEKIKDKSALFNLAIGLGLKGLDSKILDINLLPSREKKIRILLYFSILFAILGIGFLLGVFYTFIIFPFSNIPDIGNFIVPKTRAVQEVAEEEIEEEIIMVTIKDTPTGWLRVREGPGIEYAAIDKVLPGESFPLLEESEGWCKIKIEGRIDGWVSAKYLIK